MFTSKHLDIGRVNQWTGAHHQQANRQQGEADKVCVLLHIKTVLQVVKIGAIQGDTLFERVTATRHCIGRIEYRGQQSKVGDKQEGNEPNGAPFGDKVYVTQPVQLEKTVGHRESLARRWNATRMRC